MRPSKTWQFASILVLLLALFLPPSMTHAQPTCGSWNGKVADGEDRITATTVSAASGNDCHGGFLFTNTTQISIPLSLSSSATLGLVQARGNVKIGGYSLELQSASTNARFAWFPQISPQLPTYLHPAGPLEMHAFPNDAFSNSRVNVSASVTQRSMALDIGVSLLQSALDAFSPPTPCYVSPELVISTSSRLTGVLGAASTQALAGNGPGVYDELMQVSSDFYERAADMFIEAGVSCAIDSLKLAYRVEVVLTKLIITFVMWLEGMGEEYFKYKASTVSIPLDYRPDALAADWARMEASWDRDDEAAIAALEEIMQIDPNYRETKEKLYALLVGKADRLQKEGDRDGAIAALKRALEVKPDGVEAQQLLTSLNTSLIAYAGTDGNIWVIKPDGADNQRITTARQGQIFNSPRWSPDGKSLVFAETQRVGNFGQTLGGMYIYNNSSIRQVPNIHGCRSPAFTRDGTGLLMSCGRNEDGPIFNETRPSQLLSNPTLGAVSSSRLDGSDWRVLIPYGQGGTLNVGSSSIVKRIDVSNKDGSILIITGGTEGSGSVGIIGSGSNAISIITKDNQPIPYTVIFDNSGDNLIGMFCRPFCALRGNGDWDGDISIFSRDNSPISRILSLPRTSYGGTLSLSSDGTSVAYTAPIIGSAETSTQIYVAKIPDGPPKAIAQGTAPAWQPVPARIALPDTPTASGSPAQPAKPKAVTSTVVWKPSDTAVRRVYQCNRNIPCIQTAMRANGASPEAVTFMEVQEGKFFAYEFIPIGIVDVVKVYCTFATNFNCGYSYIIVNGTPPTVEVGLPGWQKSNELSSKIQANPTYQSIVRSRPNTAVDMEWSGEDVFDRAEPSSSGQQLVFWSPIKECHACKPLGRIYVAYRFDSAGNYLGRVLMNVDRMP